ncbi:MAG TPA: ABC transporter permease subunit [Candidatus Dormibacteraeota bacterium]|nr:ABC transporter permease subunit [Candidatus Dormibacteraeota bacterium]
MTAYLRHTLAANAPRTSLVAAALAAWGVLMPVIYATFGADFRALVDAGLIPKPLLDYLGGDVLTPSSSVALGVAHPISVFLKSLMPVGLGLYAVAGERQRGTLEVVLARPIARQAVHADVMIAIAVASAGAVGAELLGAVAGSFLVGAGGALPLDRLALLWLDGALLYMALGAVALLASVSTDRLAPAATAALIAIVVSYVADTLAQLWPDARGLGPWSLFHYLDARAVLAGTADPSDALVLVTVVGVSVIAGRIVFARRDLAAPA